MLFDEFLYLLIGKRMMSDPEDRNKFNRYIKIINNCYKEGTVEGCYDVCTEFNINRMTYIFEGESKPLKDFIDNLRKVILKLEGEELINLFKENTETQ